MVSCTHLYNSQWRSWLQKNHLNDEIVVKGDSKDLQAIWVAYEGDND